MWILQIGMGMGNDIQNRDIVVDGVATQSLSASFEVRHYTPYGPRLDTLPIPHQAETAKAKQLDDTCYTQHKSDSLAADR